MSGGSWDYFYNRLGEVAERLQMARSPLRRALGAHLEKVAQALHDIEWVDSADMSPGDEEDAIRVCLSPGQEADALVGELRDCIGQAEVLLDRLARERTP